jgi:DEAD/DEAH box helicase domain-containing protein
VTSQGEGLLKLIGDASFFRGQIVHVEHVPGREALFGEEVVRYPRVSEALRALGIEHLYSHQSEAISLIHEGRSVVVVTGTASGKTLCYLVPTLEVLLAEPRATMLYLYPTKALAQDQLRGLGRFSELGVGFDFLAGAYDGDTPQSVRRRLRDKGNVILTNPDMLHQGILPHHSRWNRLFANLRYVVLDEVHAYRGVFGSHVANVMRRLRRICRHYGAQPQFIASSATIANPQEHASRICGTEMALVSRDGSPRGRKLFVLWNPPLLERESGGPEPLAGGDRRSALWEAVELMTAMVRERVQTISFVRTRQAAELIFRHSRELLGGSSGRLAESVHAYRGGYLAEDRREIERRLASGEILGVASTNALELGIDIGSLDVCIIVGYPGTIASTWQQAGRAGRKKEDALVFLVGSNSPIDQYLLGHHDYLFRQNPEQAVVDPDNPHIAISHLKAAIYELPLPAAEAESFGPFAQPLLELLREESAAREIDGTWYWSHTDYPAADVSLRNISGPVYTIQQSSPTEQVIGTMDEITALSQLHTHAVYLHEADTYFVDRLDLEKKIAFVSKQELDYYTQAVTASQIKIDQAIREGTWHGCQSAFGDVSVTTTIPMFKKLRFHSRDSIGYEKLDLPPQILETVAFWLVPPEEVAAKVRAQGLTLAEGLVGIANVLTEVSPLFVMCDTQDIGTVVDSSNLGRDALFLFDRYPGGMGYAERCLEQLEPIMEAVGAVLAECPCEAGCPSCVGAPVPAFALSDIDSSTRGRIPSKDAARLIMSSLLGGT